MTGRESLFSAPQPCAACGWMACTCTAPFSYGVVCPNCGVSYFGFHDCPMLRDLSPLGGGPEP